MISFKLMVRLMIISKFRIQFWLKFGLVLNPGYFLGVRIRVKARFWHRVRGKFRVRAMVIIRVSVSFGLRVKIQVMAVIN